MNIKDYTLKIGYRIGGKCKEESVEYALRSNMLKDEFSEYLEETIIKDN